MTKLRHKSWFKRMGLKLFSLTAVGVGFGKETSPKRSSAPPSSISGQSFQQKPWGGCEILKACIELDAENLYNNRKSISCKDVIRIE